MKNKITDNMGLKILSILVAVVLWVIVNSLNNPSITKVFYNIPVTLTNTEIITDKGQVYQILDNTGIIPRVSVRAPQSVISELGVSNIVAVADVADLSSLDTIAIKLSTNIYQNQINSITGNVDTVKLSIENSRSRTLPLMIVVSGEPEEGYMVKDYSADQNLVLITGPESVINTVDSAKAEVDVGGFTSDVKTSAEIRLYDAEDREVESDVITQNMKSTGVDITILQTKEVPIVFNISDEAHTGYRSTGQIEPDRTTANISGRSSLLKNIDSISIPGEALSIADKRETFATKVDIEKYLPEGVYLVDPSESVYTVVVYIEAESSKRISVTSDEIRITNVPAGYKVTASVDEGTMLELIGLSDDLSLINRDSINAVIDMNTFMDSYGMTELSEGFYNAEVTFELPSSVNAVDKVQATIHIVRD